MLKLKTVQLTSPPLGERIRPTQQVSLPTDPAGPGRSAEMGSSPRGAVAGNQESCHTDRLPRRGHSFQQPESIQ